jgi:hypothetical protein
MQLVRKYGWQEDEEAEWFSPPCGFLVAISVSEGCHSVAHESAKPVHI